VAATPGEIVTYPAAPQPMTLVIRDEAVGLLNADTPEGQDARNLVLAILKTGRKAGIEWQVSWGTLDRLRMGHLRRVARELASAGRVQAAPSPRRQRQLEAERPRR
jgi:hypothetical protein